MTKTTTQFAEYANATGHSYDLACTRVEAARRILANTYVESPYGFAWGESYDAATEVVARKVAQSVEDGVDHLRTVIEGDRPCSNCGRLAVANGRCRKCQHLPSDEV